VLVAGAAHAQPEETVLVGPQREGFTIELDGGVGWTRFFDNHGQVVPGGWFDASAAGLDVGLGAFLSSTFALGFRFTGDTGFERRTTTDHIRGLALAQVAGQWWLEDTLYLGAGFGFAMVGGQDQQGSNSESALGLGASARVGLAFLVRDDSAWSAALEVNGGMMIDDRRAYSASLLLCWQSF
jgi:hypothetical protein